MFKGSAAAATIACGLFALALSFVSPQSASADPVVIPAPDYVPRDAGARPSRATSADRGYQIVQSSRVYGRRSYIDEAFEDDETSRYYDSETLPRRIPTYRERTGRVYARDHDDYYEAPRPTYRARRYYEDPDFYYESSEPERLPRRLAGPPSTYGAAEGRRTVDPKFARTTVRYDGSEPAGSIVINTRTRYLFLVQGDGTAIRYGVGVGKEGFTWKGVNNISAKREWPDWYPPAEMRQRRPELPTMMAGGPDNPLGARALYLGSTLYRIHGSNEPWTIGRAVSSGCIRMTNEDVTDLYDRVKVGTVVKVM